MAAVILLVLAVFVLILALLVNAQTRKMLYQLDAYARCWRVRVTGSTTTTTTTIRSTPMDTKEQINPCPICGEKEALDVYPACSYYFVMCGQCGYRGWLGRNIEEAVKVWNEN